MAGIASTIADLSTVRSFSLLELAKARVLSYKLDTTGYLNPDLHHHADLEALRNLEGTFVITSVHQEVTKEDKTDLTREEWPALGYLLCDGKTITVMTNQLGGEEATWSVECSSGSLFSFKVCHYEEMFNNGTRATCAIEGRAMVQKLWREAKVDELLREARGEEFDLLAQDLRGGEATTEDHRFTRGP